MNTLNTSHEQTLEELNYLYAGLIFSESEADNILRNSSKLLFELPTDDCFNLLNYLHERQGPIPLELQEALTDFKDSPDVRIRRSFYRLIGKGKLSINPLELTTWLEAESDPVAQSLIVDALNSLCVREALPLLKARLLQIDEDQNDELFVVKKSLEMAIANLLRK